MGVHPQPRRARAPPSSTPPTTSRRPSATPTRCWCWPTASCSSPARRASWRTRSASRRGARLRGGVRGLPARARALDACAGCCSRTCRSCAARRCWWRCSCSTRSSIATLIGFALSRGPDKPEVAFVNGVPPSGKRDRAGRRARSTSREQAGPLFEAIDPVRVNSPRGGDPEGARRRRARRARDPRGHHARSSRRASSRATVEVFYNAEDPVKRAVRARTRSSRRSRTPTPR